MILILALRSAFTWASLHEPMSAYEVPWLHSVCPSSTIRLRISAPRGAVTFCPITQNVALTPLLARKSSRASVSPGLGPSSTVSAATLPSPRAWASGVVLGATAPGTNVGSGVGVQAPPVSPLITRSSTR